MNLRGDERTILASVRLDFAPPRLSDEAQPPAHQPQFEAERRLLNTTFHSRWRRLGATLVEVMMSLAVAAIALSGVVGGYILAARRTEWSSCAAAAQAMAMERLEQTRAAKWDPIAYPPIDDLVTSNFPVVVETLDIPLARSGSIQGTNTTFITDVSLVPPVRKIRVECVWSLPNRGPFTNAMMSYRSPDQ